jgi:WD40 repeat protein
LVSGCFNGTLCLWNGDTLRQTNVHAHRSSVIIDLNFSGHSSNVLSLATDKRLCIWTYGSLQLIYELNDISSNCLTIHRTNYLFYCQMNSLFIYDTLNPTKNSTKQFSMPFANDSIDNDNSETNIDKISYSASNEMLILQSADVIYAMHLPQQLFLLR